MKNLITPFVFVALSSVPVLADTCFSLVKTTQVNSPASASMAMMMKNIPANQITPAMKKMLDQQKKMLEPKKIQNYMNERYQVETSANSVSITDYDQLTMTNIDLDNKTYRITDMKEFFAKMGETLKKIKIPKPKVQASGKTQTIAGIKCQDYTMTMSMDPSSIGSKESAAMLKGMKFESEVIRCVNPTEPAAYHTIRKAHGEKVLKVMPADVRERFKEMAGGDKSMFGGFEMPSGATGDGFELEMRTVSKMKNAPTGKPAQDPTMMAMMNSGAGGFSAKVESVGTSCPPASTLTIPAGFKRQEVPTMPGPGKTDR